MFGTRNLKYFYLKKLRKIRDYLLSNKSREFLIFLFFFMVSGGFWLLQTLKNDYETEFSIPLKLKGVPNDVVLTSEPIPELRVLVKDKGTVLLNYMLGQQFYPLTIDFADYQAKGSRVKILASDLEKRIATQLGAQTKLLSIKPDTIEYIYAKGKAKKVPVKVSGKVEAGRQYYVSDTIYMPDSVVIYAPPAMLDTIQVVYTDRIDFQNITDTLRQQVPLRPIKGVKFVPPSVGLTFLVDIFTEKAIEVPLVGVNFPADKVLRTFPSKVKVTFQVGLRHFKSICPDDFVLYVSYEELISQGTDKYKVQLKAVPPGVSHVRIIPNQVDFLIEQVPVYGY